MHSLLARASGLGFLFVISIGLLAAYVLQLAETNEYVGYRAIPLDLEYLIRLLIGVVSTGLLMPARIIKPSDFFPLLYGLFVLLPYATLHPIRQETSLLDFLLYFLALAAPLFAVKLITLMVPQIRLPTMIKESAVIVLLICICLFGLVLALSNAPSTASFDLITTYERRLDGRDIFPAQSPLAYLNSAIVNGFAPFLAFIAGLRRKTQLFVLSLIFVLGYFYLLGLKAPILFVMLAFMIGRITRAGKITHLVKILYLIVIGTIAGFLVEYLLFGFSLLGDYLIRRAFSVPPYLVSAYFEFMSSSPMKLWNLIEGAVTAEPITFVVGETFLGFPGLNANTNAFLYQLAAGGIPMYLLTTLIVATVFVILDSAYVTRWHPAVLYLGFSYSMLITEQAATTALMSSGIGLLIAATVFLSTEPCFRRQECASIRSLITTNPGRAV